jgi:hypothetical protein
VHGVIADSAGAAWTFGGSIPTFAFPMILSHTAAAGTPAAEPQTRDPGRVAGALPPEEQEPEAGE